MRGTHLRLLRKLSQKGDISVKEAAKLLPSRKNKHRDFYPIVTLIEANYLGMTIDYVPPSNGEGMREFGMAHFLYMLTLPKDEEGIVEYNGIKSIGSMSSDSERIFIKADGFLYLESLKERRNERVATFFLGLFTALFVNYITRYWFA